MPKSISPTEFKSLIDSHSDFQLIDVREDIEYEFCNIKGAILCPLSELKNHIHKIDIAKKVVVYCHHGIRSAQAIIQLERILKTENLYNLSGGIHQWSVQIDKSVKVY
jgi:rhodanese-related sulfurtransferase